MTSSSFPTLLLPTYFPIPFPPPSLSLFSTIVLSASVFPPPPAVVVCGLAGGGVPAGSVPV